MAHSNEDWLTPEQRATMLQYEERLLRGWNMIEEAREDTEKGVRYLTHWRNLLEEYEDTYLKFGVENGVDLGGSACPVVRAGDNAGQDVLLPVVAGG